MDCNESNYKNKTVCQSLKNAINGICLSIRSERNLIIHLAATILVVIAGILLNIDVIRWVSITFVIGLVLVSELLNTSIEKLTDMVITEYSDEAKRVKDIGAAAVLVSAVFSIIVGVLVFIGPIIELFN